MNVFSNIFEGTLPDCISRWRNLGTFLAYDNQFSGNLYNVFNASNQELLFQVDVSSNQLTGTLPGDIFNAKVLSAFAAVDNGIHGSIPHDVCHSKLLTALLLDGLMSSSSCQHKMIAGVNTYTLGDSNRGGVPQCLFSMPVLKTLHLSGNALTGSIDSNVNISARLTDLSLSHNDLSGAIPVQLQKHNWSNFDLSYNKFNGELNSDFMESAIGTTVTLEVNRLSGRIPQSLQTASSVDILSGNLFSCNLQRSNLPSSDPDYATYQCGSNSLNYSLFLFVAIIGTVFVLWSVTRMYQNNEHIITLGLMLDGWYSLFTSVENEDTISKRNSGFIALGTALKNVRLCGICVLTLVLLLLPIYVALSHYYSMYSISYAWEVSAIYLSGINASVILLCFWCLFGLLVAIILFCILPPIEVASESSETDNQQNWKLKMVMWTKAYSVAGWVLIVNGFIVTIVNIGYVYVNHNFESIIIFLVQIAVVIFKLIWNGFVVKRLVRTMLQTSGTEYLGPLISRVLLFTSLVLFNNLIAPFIATSVISTDCFYNVFVPSAKVTSAYTDTECPTKYYDYETGQFVCGYENSITVTSKYTPPFIYSYECASTFVSTYANVYVYMFIIVGFVMPVYQICVKLVLIRWADHKNIALLCLTKHYPHCYDQEMKTLRMTPSLLRPKRQCSKLTPSPLKLSICLESC